MAKRPGIAALRHKVVLCSQRDVIDNDGDLTLNRTEVRELWADIEPKAAQRMTQQGAAREERDRRSHIIYTRAMADINLSQMAWVYERRLKSAPRWFKVLKVTETEHRGSPFWMLDVRLYERTDDAVEPTDSGFTAAKKMPHGIEL